MCITPIQQLCISCENFGRLTLPGRRTVLADMLELGPDSLAMHASMAEAIVGHFTILSTAMVNKCKH